jgi:hypothetical protein
MPDGTRRDHLASNDFVFYRAIQFARIKTTSSIRFIFIRRLATITARISTVCAQAHEPDSHAIHSTKSNA